MAGNDRTAKPIGDQVTIMHAGPAYNPRRLVDKSAHDIAMLGWWNAQRGIALCELNHHTVWCLDDLFTIGDRSRVISLQTQTWAGCLINTAQIKP